MDCEMGGMSPTAADEPASNGIAETINTTPLPTASEQSRRGELVEKQDNPRCAQDYWAIARSQLREERDRLGLWKSSFTNRDLDSLLKNGSIIYNDLGNSVVEALVSIAEALLKSTRKASQLFLVYCYGKVFLNECDERQISIAKESN